MTQLFDYLSTTNLFDDYACILDWVLSENKFDTWDTKQKIIFTKRLREKLFPDPYIFKLKDKKDKYPNKVSQRKNPYALFTGKALGIDFVRHLRNGIAHGRSNCFTVRKTAYIEIIDSYKNEQTAYISIPLDFLRDVHRIFKEINEVPTTKQKTQ